MGVFCPKCHKDCIVKNGLRNGIQSYKCKSCNRQFINKKKYSEELKFVVNRLCEEKINYRVITTIAGLRSISLISYWVKQEKKDFYSSIDDKKALEEIAKIEKGISVFIDRYKDLQKLEEEQGDIKITGDWTAKKKNEQAILLSQEWEKLKEEYLTRNFKKTLEELFSVYNNILEILIKLKYQIKEHTI